MKGADLLWACQILVHHANCCLRWKRVHCHWALTINLVRNMQHSFSQLHFSGSLSPCIFKGHFKKSSLELLQVPLKDESMTKCADTSACREEAPYQIHFWEITLLIRMAMFAGDLQQEMSSTQSCISTVCHYRETRYLRTVMLVPIWLNSLPAPSRRYQRDN